ncbi:MAG TPA: hypothetical protein ENK18_14470 [Deltaproteobacteria bacterium]|nr:hypothetical protein [Deltaproteobacteria bacterium]
MSYVVWEMLVPMILASSLALILGWWLSWFFRGSAGSDLQQRITELEGSLEAERSERTQLEERARRLRERLDGRGGELQIEQDGDLDVSMQRQALELDQLRAELAGLRAELASTEDKLGVLSTFAVSVGGALGVDPSSADGMLDRIAEIQGLNAAYFAELSETRDELEELSARADAGAAADAALQELAALLEVSSPAPDAVLEGISELRGAHEAELATLQEALDVQRRRAAEAGEQAGELEAARARITEIEAQLAASAQALTQREADCSACESERAAQAAELERLRVEIEQLSLPPEPGEPAGPDRGALAALTAETKDKPSETEVSRAQDAVRAIAARTRAAGEVVEDDLKRVHGIGPVIERLLKSMGIVSFRQIASFEEAEIQTIGVALKTFPKRILRDNWMRGARMLHEEVHGEVLQPSSGEALAIVFQQSE